MNLIERLQSVIVTGEIDLSELDAAYQDDDGKPLVLPFRLNWTRGQKDRQRELMQETVELQQHYANLREMTGDELLEEKRRIDALSDEHWLHWAEWWAGIFLMERDEVIALNNGIPEQHWVWITAQAAGRAREYEDSALKKAGGGPSPTSAERAATRRKSGKGRT